MRCLVPIVLLSGLLSSVTASAGLRSASRAATPNSSIFRVLEPFKFQAQLGQVSGPATETRANQHYFANSDQQFTNWGPPSPGPTVTVRAVRDTLQQAVTGVFFICAHGASDGSGAAIEVYSTYLDFYAAWLAYAADHSFDGMLEYMTVSEGATTYYCVGVRWAALAGWLHGGNSIVHVAGCDGGRTFDGWGQAGVRAWVDYNSDVESSVDYWDSVQFWGRLDQGCSGCFPQDPEEARTVDGATLYTSLTADPAFGPEATLSPAVDETNVWNGFNINLHDYFDVWFVFDTDVDESVPAWSAVIVRPPFEALYPHWDTYGGKDALVVTVHPLYEGIGDVGLSGTMVRSATNWLMPLDGNLAEAGNGDDFVVSLKGSNNPAAAVGGFAVSAGVARWIVESECQTASYSLEASGNVAGPWQPIITGIQPGQGTYAIDISAAAAGYQFVRLMEAEGSGLHIRRGTALVSGSAGSSQGAGGNTDPTETQLLARLADLAAARTASEPSFRQSVGQGRKYVIFCPDEFVADTQAYVKGFWDWWGYDGEVIGVSGFPGHGTDRALFRESIHARILTKALQGVRYFLLAGDSNDYAEMADDALWPPPWDATLYALRNNGIVYPNGQPANDVIPTYTVPDTLPQPANMAWIRPYWFTDWPYGDTTGDGVPDVVVTRWPITSRRELLNMAARMQTYNQDGYFGGGAYAGSLYLNNMDTVDGAGVGALAEAAADSVVARLGSTHLTVLRTSDYADLVDPCARNQAGLFLWNGTPADFALLISSGSWRYAPGSFFDKATSNPCPFSVVDLAANQPRLVLAGSCQGGATTVTETVANGTPVVEDFLLTGGWNEGAAVWIGPSLGTWQSGNEGFLKLLAEEMLRDATRPLADSWLAACQRTYAEFAAPIDEGVRETAKAYMFYGDPLSRLNHAMQSGVGAPEVRRDAPSVLIASPNPFVDYTVVRGASGQGEHVRVVIYDVAGRVVKRLVDRVVPSRSWEARWDGIGQGGKRAAPGVYFVVARGKSWERSTKVIRVR